MAGFQEEDYEFSLMKNSITGLYSTSNPNVGMGTGDKTVIDTRNGWATRGFFGRINYDYDGRYLVELNGRYDGSSRLPQAIVGDSSLPSLWDGTLPANNS